MSNPLVRNLKFFGAVTVNDTDLMKYINEAIEAGNTEFLIDLFNHFVTIGNTEMIKVLLTKRVHEKYINCPVQIPIRIAILHGNDKMLKVLLTDGGDVFNIAYDQIVDPPLHYAAKLGQEDIVKFLVEFGIDVNAVQKDGKTALFEAVDNGHLNIVKYLIEKGASVICSHHYCMANNITLLHLAAVQGYKDICKYLLSHGVNVNDAQINGCTPLHYAAKRGFKEIVKILVENGADINAVAYDSQTPMTFAIKEKHLTIVDFFLQNQSDEVYRETITAVRHSVNKHINDCISNNALQYRSFLNDCVEKGCKNMLEHIFNHDSTARASINESTVLHDSLLHVAIGKGHKEMVKMLLQYGADATTKNKLDMTPLDYVFKYRQYKMCRLILNSITDINDINYALYAVARHGYARDVEMLLQRGANVNWRSIKGLTPLHAATSAGRLRIVEILLNFGADINATCVYGNTPLFYALHAIRNLRCIRSNTSCVTAKLKHIVKVLVQEGANVNHRNNHGKVVLHYAIHGPIRSDIVEIFLKYDADVNAVEDYSKSPVRCRETSHMASCILAMHIVKAKAAGAEISEKNAKWINKYREDLHIPECEDEIEKLKNEKITASVSFFDFLTKGINKIATLTRHPYIRKAFEYGAYKRKFPIYGDILECRFIRGTERKCLIDMNKRNIKHLLQRNLPDIITEKILSNLSIRCLENLSKV